MRDRAATRALILGLLSLPFGILSLIAIFSAARSLRRAPSASALVGLSFFTIDVAPAEQAPLGSALINSPR